MVNHEISVLRPSLVALLFGFVTGFSLTVKTFKIPYGAGYVMASILTGIVFSLLALVTVFVFQVIRRYLTKPGDEYVSSKSKPGLFSPIVSMGDAMSAFKVAIWVLVIVVGADFYLYLSVGNIRVGALSVVLFFCLPIIAFKTRSRALAVIIILFSIYNVFVVGQNRFFGSNGGSNLFSAFLLLWAHYRIVIAIFKLHVHPLKDEAEITTMHAEQIDKKCEGIKEISTGGEDQRESFFLESSCSKDENIGQMPMPLISKNEKIEHEIKKNESKFYEQIWKDIEKNKTDVGLWANCFANCDGDENKTKALYVNKKIVALKEELRQQLLDKENENLNDSPEQKYKKLKNGLSKELRGIESNFSLNLENFSRDLGKKGK